MPGSRGKRIEFDLSQVGGVDTRVWQGKGTANDAKGVVFTRRGEVAKHRGVARIIESWDGGNPFGSNPILSLGVLNRSGLVDLVLGFSDKLKVLNQLTAANLVPTQSGFFTTGRPRDAVRMFQAGDVLVVLNGRDGNVKWDGRKVTPLGIASPPPPPQEPVAWTNTGATSNLWTNASLQGNTARIQYRVTWLNDRGQESEPSAPSSAVDYEDAVGQGPVGSTDYFLVFLRGLASDPPSDDIVARNLYRSTDGGLTWKLLRRLGGTSTDTFWDGTPVGAEGVDLMYAEGTNLPPPVARGGFVFRGRTYYWGVEDSPALLFYSNVNAKESVAAGNFLDVDSSDGDVLTGGIVAQDFAVVFKRRAVYLLTHDKEETPVLTPVVKGVGCVSDRSAATFSGRVVFLGERGLYVYDGSQVRSLSNDISEMVRALPSGYLEDACAWVDEADGRAYLSVVAGPGSENNEVWCVHMASGAVTRLADFQVFSATPYKGQTFVGVKYTHSGAGVYDLGVWDAGWTLGPSQGYDGIYETRWMDFGSPETDKRVSRLDVAYVGTMSGSMTVEWFANWDNRTAIGSVTFPLSDDAATVWGSGNWDSVTRKWDGARTATKRLDLAPTLAGEFASIGKALQFRFKTTGVDTPFLLVGGSVFVADLGVREEGSDL